MINMLMAPTDKVDYMQEHIGNVSKEVDIPRKKWMVWDQKYCNISEDYLSRFDLAELEDIYLQNWKQAEKEIREGKK